MIQFDGPQIFGGTDHQKNTSTGGWLGAGNSNMFEIFTAKIGEDEANLTIAHIFPNGFVFETAN